MNDIARAKEYLEKAASLPAEYAPANTLLAVGQLLSVVEQQQAHIEKLERQLQAIINKTNCYDFEGV